MPRSCQAARAVTNTKPSLPLLRLRAAIERIASPALAEPGGLEAEAFELDGGTGAGGVVARSGRPYLINTPPPEIHHFNRARPTERTSVANSRTHTCRSHCPACGAHFTGDEGFDLHRVGSYRVPADHFDARRCIDPTEDKRFAAVSGECRISDPDNPKAGVAIWNLARRRQGVLHAGRPKSHAGLRAGVSVPPSPGLSEGDQSLPPSGRAGRLPCGPSR